MSNTSSGIKYIPTTKITDVNKENTTNLEETLTAKYVRTMHQIKVINSIKDKIYEGIGLIRNGEGLLENRCPPYSTNSTGKRNIKAYIIGIKL
jgi:hypothetical protein